ncbi:DoxX family membrane protein [Pedobacter sp.]|nr:DoxX family membrane protein [Candidatus Saccharibacteria bacterium]
MAKKTQTSVPSTRVWYGLAVTRILLGLIFLWAFFDKLFGLGFATPAARAWLNGGSPTTGFLKNVAGPFSDFFTAMAGSPVADWLFMLGLFGIGVGLVFGVAVRLAAASGIVLVTLMWLASFPLENNPLLDDHVVYASILAVIAFAAPQQKWSLVSWWVKLPVVKTLAWLK